jgi:SAM-dependent methyltransferase
VASLRRVGSDRTDESRGVLRSILGWPARRLLDRRFQWMLNGFNYRQDRLELELRRVTELLSEGLLDRRLAILAAGEELVVPIDTARFLNWAEGPEGPAARAGLWFNPPVPVHYEENSVEVLAVSERIVEQPYVFASLASIPGPLRILDVGGSESTVALSLASLGHEVHVVDPRGYRPRHPQLREHSVRLEQFDADLRFDVALALSAIEHFGLGSYSQPVRGDRADRAALAEMRRRLVPDGLLVLTVPCAPESSCDDFQRTYSLSELTGMLADDWEVLDLSVAWQRDVHTWSLGTPESHGERGVAMVRAKRKPDAERPGSRSPQRGGGG